MTTGPTPTTGCDAANASGAPASRRAMRTAILSACFGTIAQGVVTDSSIIILYAGMLGASSFVALCTTSLQQMALAALYIPVAYWMSRSGKKRLAIPALVIGTAGLLFAAVAPAFGNHSRLALLAGLSVFSVSIAIYIVAWFPLLKGVVPPDECGRFFGRLRISWQITLGVFLLVAAWLVRRISGIVAFQVIVAAAALIGFVRVFLLWRIPEAPPSRQEPLWKTLAALVRDRPLMGFSAYLFWLYIFAGSTMQVAVLLASRSLNMANSLLVLLSAGMMLGAIAGYYLGGRIVDSRGTRMAFLIGHGGFAVLNFLLLAVQSNAASCSALLLGVGVFYGMVYALASIAVNTEAFQLVPRQREEVGLAVCLGLQYAGLGLSRFLAGWVLDSGLLAPHWNMFGRPMTQYHTLFLFNGAGVLASCVLLGMIPSLLARPNAPAKM